MGERNIYRVDTNCETCWVIADNEDTVRKIAVEFMDAHEVDIENIRILGQGDQLTICDTNYSRECKTVKDWLEDEPDGFLGSTLF